MALKKISQNLSSDSLFHFVKRREWLIEIIKNKSFQARYVYEEMPEMEYKVAIPMKCFCDIPLGVIKKHLVQYGKYGIGITKDFAKRNYLSPVIYFHKNSATFYSYISTISKNDIFKNQFSLIPYFKADIRIKESTDGKKIIERYYDEREWRFVPRGAKFIDFSGFDEDEIRNTRLDFENKKLENDGEKFSLPFEYIDITYIFVSKEDDVDKVIAEIRSVKLPHTQQDRLIAKIITARQIERDF